MDKVAVLEIVKRAVLKLEASKMLEGEVFFAPSLSLLGPTSAFDSLAFISFLTEVEENVSDEFGSDVYIVLNDIEGFNVNQTKLSVEELVDHICKLVA